MKLQNGYKIIYEAKDRISEEKPGSIYASKTLPSIEDAMLVSYNNGASYVDLKSFKLIYSDGAHLLGSISGIPGSEDINIVIKAGDEIVFGEVIETPVEEQRESEVKEPEEQKEPVVEQPVEEPVVE